MLSVRATMYVRCTVNKHPSVNCHMFHIMLCVCLPLQAIISVCEIFPCREMLGNWTRVVDQGHFETDPMHIVLF